MILLHSPTLLMTCPDVQADMACMQLAVHLILTAKVVVGVDLWRCCVRWAVACCITPCRPDSGGDVNAIPGNSII